MYQLDGVTFEFEKAPTYLDAVRLLQPETYRHVLAVKVNGRTVPLTACPEAGAVAETVTYHNEEGRRVYERSIRFVLLIAVKDLYPAATVRCEHSFGDGVYIEIRNLTLTASVVKKIETRMREIVNESLPFMKENVSREDAKTYFAQTGQTDKVELLNYRPFEYFWFYSCGGVKEYFYGEMTPTTGYVDTFELRFYLPGVILRLPTAKSPYSIGPFHDMPKLMHTYKESSVWGEILGCQNAADLNGMIEKKQIREFIRVNEALHERSIARIADRFVESGARLILIAGPSSSGKTTFAHRLSIALRAIGLKPVKVSLDDYYLDRDQILPDENGEVDLEKIDTLDIDLLDAQLVQMLQGETVNAPLFDFTRGKRSEKTHEIRIAAGQPIVIEGIHGLNERLTANVPREMKFKIYVSALTTLNLDDHNRIRATDARLIRRMVRDFQFRNTLPEETMNMWPLVRRGEDNYIFPYQEEADVMFNSTLDYELAVMKKYVYPMLVKVPPESRHYTLARRLVKFLNYIHTADVEDEVPPNSILREFIGGNCFYREED